MAATRSSCRSARTSYRVPGPVGRAAVARAAGLRRERWLIICLRVRIAGQLRLPTTSRPHSTQRPPLLYAGNQEELSRNPGAGGNASVFSVRPMVLTLFLDEIGDMPEEGAADVSTRHGAPPRYFRFGRRGASYGARISVLIGCDQSSRKDALLG